MTGVASARGSVHAAVPRARRPSRRGSVRRRPRPGRRSASSARPAPRQARRRPCSCAALAAFGVVVGSGVVLVRRLRHAAAMLEQTIRQVEEAGSRLQVLVEHVPAAVYIDMADPDVSDGGRLAYMSPQISGILGYRPEELVDDPELWPSRIHPDDRAAALAAYEAHWRTGEPLRAEYRMLGPRRHRGLGPRRGLRDARRHPERAAGLAGPARRHHRPQAAGVEADPRRPPRPADGARQPGPPPRSPRACPRAAGSQPGTVALLFVDLDDFKRINDSYGHAAGDQILVRVAERLVGAVRAEDVVGRQSGDEFAVLLGQCPRRRRGDRRGASGSCGELRRPILLGAHSIVVGGSIGIAVATRRPSATAEDLLTQADAAMYAAKADGKGTFAVYDPRMPTRTWTELEAAG